jgi:hypothetical protein
MRLPLARHSFLVAAMLAATAVSAPARAAVTVYYHVGAWDAFDGPGDDGRPVCGIGTRNPADGRTFSLRFSVGGDDTVTFIASKTGWQIPDGTAMPVVMQIGLQRPWNVQARGNADRVQWALDRDAIQEFDAQFRRAGSMTVTFPSGNEPPWVLSLSGSTAVSNAMGRCITDLARRTAVPGGTAPAAAQGPTQPFAPGSTPSDNNAPANAPPGPGGAAPANPADNSVPANPPPANDQMGTQPPATQPNAAH